jgi:PHD/YefM family antitoxin component YafN of YafNO toxin-antitoxin module
VKVGAVMDKPVITRDQMVKASEASKRFGTLRKKAKDLPQFITENGIIDSVLMDYDYYERLYQRLVELEEKEEARILSERIERLDQDPSLAVSWKEVRRSNDEYGC